VAGDSKTNSRNSGDKVRVRTSRPSLGSGGAEKAAGLVERRKKRQNSALAAAQKALGVKPKK